MVQATTLSYEGGTSAAGLFHGQGRAVFASGLVYDGAWHNGMMEGDARLAFPDGVEYEGSMHANSMEGTGVSTFIHKVHFTCGAYVDGVCLVSWAEHAWRFAVSSPAAACFAWWYTAVHRLHDQAALHQTHRKSWPCMGQVTRVGTAGA